jgi:trehalose 6-phosphate phosphatase
MTQAGRAPAPGGRFDAVLFDLDGVVTRTAKVHARAWKRAFDDFLRDRAAHQDASFVPFDEGSDYRSHVDGKPRYDGVRSFLRARGITLPEGQPDDPPDRVTICGLGNRKDELFLELVRRDGVEVYEDAVRRIDEWRAAGLRTAVVSSSRNCAEVLRAAGLADRFEVRVDGVVVDTLGLQGKPAPDMFLEAARRLRTEPARAAVIEDAEAGVEAGRRGGFGIVVGVDRGRSGEALLRHGADVVVRSLLEIDLAVPARAAEAAGGAGPRDASRLPSALREDAAIGRRLAGRMPAVFLDYDGTLTPIVARPELATLSPSARAAVEALAALCTVAVVSGRDRADVARLVDVDTLIYAGSHGFDISGPDGLRLEHEGAAACLPDLDAAEQEVRNRLASIDGALLERKRFGIAAHYRNVAERDTGAVESAVDEAVARHPGLRKTGGKKVFELRPDLDWDKGRAMLWLLSALRLEGEGTMPIFVGDDRTDEDAFAALAGRGVGIVVGRPDHPTRADYALRDPAEVERWLREMAERLSGRRR